MKADSEISFLFNVAAVSSGWQFCVFGFLFFVFSAFLLLNFLPNSFFPAISNDHESKECLSASV